jgi:hypothetical protein
MLMAYMLLIVEPPDQRGTRTLEEGREAYDSMVRFGEDLKSRGMLIASESLAAGGVRVQKRDGRASLVDGPFAEAKEMIGGFFLLECATREQAIAIAHECPAADWCTVEVRKIGPCWE